MLFDPYGPARPQQDCLRAGLLPAQNCRNIMKIMHAQRNTKPVWVQTSSKHPAGLHGMPCDYSRVIKVSALTGPRTARELHMALA